MKGCSGWRCSPGQCRFLHIILLIVSCGGLPTLWWQYLLMSTVPMKGQKRPAPGAPEDSELDPGLGLGTVQQERGLACMLPEPCLKDPLAVVLLWGSGENSRGVGLRSWIHGDNKQLLLHHKKWMDETRCAWLSSVCMDRDLRSNLFTIYPVEPLLSAYPVLLAVMDLFGVQLSMQSCESRGYLLLYPSMFGSVHEWGRMWLGSNNRKTLIFEQCSSSLP